MYEPRRSRRIEEGYPFTYTPDVRHSLISPFAKKIGVIFVAATLILMITISTRGSEVTQKHQQSSFGLTTESVSADLGANILGVKDKGRIDKVGPNPEDKAKEKDGGVSVLDKIENEDDEEDEFEEDYLNKNGEDEYDDLEEDELDEAELEEEEDEDELNDGEFDEDDLEKALDDEEEIDLEDEEDLDEMFEGEELSPDEDGDDIEAVDEEELDKDEEGDEEYDDVEEEEDDEEEEEEGDYDKEAQEEFDEEEFDEGDEEGGEEEEVLEDEDDSLGGEDEEEEFEEEGGVFEDEDGNEEIDENDDVIEYNPLLILPLGDSITSGCCTEEFVGYRAELEKLLKNSGEWEEYKIEYVGSQKDKVSYHEGHPSTPTYNFLSKLEYEWLQEYIPDIVLINLGTQDLVDLKQKELDFDEVASNVTESIGEIIQGLIEINPGISIVLCEVPPTNPNQQSFLLNEKIQQFLETEFADLDNLKPDASITYLSLDVPSDWPTKYVQKDGVIPNHEGENWIASKYYEHLVKIILPEFETAQ